MGAIWVGIDVSKRRLDVAVRPAGDPLSVDNDDTGIKKLVRVLAKCSPQLIVLEATGGHEYAAAYALMRAGLSVAVVIQTTERYLGTKQDLVQAVNDRVKIRVE